MSVEITASDFSPQRHRGTGKTNSKKNLIKERIQEINRVFLCVSVTRW